MLKVEKLQKIYNMGNIIVPALSDVFLDVKPGEMICIMGKSGSGKSTLLHMLGLIDTPTSGTVYFKNKDVSKLSEAKRSKIRLAQMGFVFQEYALLPELTALENVYLPASMLGKWSKEYEERAVTLLDSVGLLERMNHRPYQLSGGQQQRVSIARAMVNRPEIIFADEPTPVPEILSPTSARDAITDDEATPNVNPADVPATVTAVVANVDWSAPVLALNKRDDSMKNAPSYSPISPAQILLASEADCDCG